MKLQHVALALAAMWVVAALAVMVGLFDVTSIGNLFALAVVGALPPVAMWFWWHEPAQTLSESIHEVRDDAARARR